MSFCCALSGSGQQLNTRTQCELAKRPRLSYDCLAFQPVAMDAAQGMLLWLQKVHTIKSEEHHSEGHN